MFTSPKARQGGWHGTAGAAALAAQQGAAQRVFCGHRQGGGSAGVRDMLKLYSCTVRVVKE